MALVDLSSIGQTCREFQYLAERMFHKKFHSNMQLRPGFNLGILRLFGEQATALQLQDTHQKVFDDREFALLNEYLPNIDALDLNLADGRIFKSDLIKKKIPILKRLDFDLQVKCNPNFDLIIDTMKQCGSNLLIEALKFHIRFKSDEWLRFLDVTYPKLRRMIIYPRDLVDRDRFERSITKFCNNHVHLKYLCIIARSISNQSLTDLKKLTNLKELSLGFLLRNREMVTTLTQLPALTRLGIVVSFFLDISMTLPLFELKHLIVFQFSIIYKAAGEINGFVDQLIKCGHNPTNVTSLIVQNTTAAAVRDHDFDAVARFIAISPYVLDLTLLKSFPLIDHFYVKLAEACQKNPLRSARLVVKLYRETQVNVSDKLLKKFGDVVSYQIKPLAYVL